MTENQNVSCRKCGATDLEYDNYWKEYSCRKCGWILQDAESTSSLPFKKEKTKSMSKDENNNQVRAKDIPGKEFPKQVLGSAILEIFTILLVFLGLICLPVGGAALIILLMKGMDIVSSIITLDQNIAQKISWVLIAIVVVILLLRGQKILIWFSDNIVVRINSVLAVLHYSKAIRRRPENEVAHTQLGLWMQKRSKSKKALESSIRSFETALQLKPGFRDALIPLCDALLKLDQPKEALDLLDVWLQHNDDYIGEFIAGKAAWISKNEGQSRAHFQRALQLFPDAPDRSEIQKYLSSDKLPLPQQSSDEQRAKQKMAGNQKIISGCAFAGAAMFIILNITTGVVPGGFIGGGIGGGLGAVVGMIINSLRK